VEQVVGDKTTLKKQAGNTHSGFFNLERFNL